MTQEELDALMAGGVEEDEQQDNIVENSEDITSLDEDSSNEEISNKDEEFEEITDENLDKAVLDEVDIEEDVSTDEQISDVIEDEIVDDEENVIDDSPKRVDPTAPTPPPADNEHKVVEQLDDVTRESEIKANEVFDKLDEISLVATNIKNSLTEQQKIVKDNIEIFERLSNKFPQIESFTTALDDNKKLLTKIEEVESESDNISNMTMETMDIMQYQDIHRQKIERVINVMRALSHYMHSLFDSSIKDDEHRASSAITIDSDNSVSEDELEALLESFAKK